MHENQMALDVWGRRSKNSGAGFFKSDVFNKDWAIEGKSSLEPRMTVTVGLLNEVVREARTRQKKPALGLAYILGDPALPRGISIGQHCYLVPEVDGPADTELQKSLVLDLSKPVVERIYRFDVTDPMVSAWWKVLRPPAARKRLGQKKSRLD